MLIYITLVAYGTRGGALLAEPNDARWEVGEITQAKDPAEGPSPAAQAGIQVGDKIVAIDGIRVETFTDLVKEIQARPGETVTLEIERDGGVIETSATLAERNPSTNEEVGFLGIGFQRTAEDVGPLEAIPRSFGELGSLGVRTLGFLGEFFSPSGISDFADQVLGREPETPAPGSGGTSNTPENVRPTSIIGVVRVAGEAAEFGFVNLLLILISVNVFVGVFNLIPLLPFDGGHAAIATYERIRSRRGKRYFVDVAKLMPITYMVVLLLGMLFLTTTYLDIFHFPN
jgi:membrane-associated protease RseP (regulator of RpoE activity)